MSYCKMTIMRFLWIAILSVVISYTAQASYILLPMDEENQTEHLKAYGITYWVLEKGVEALSLIHI